MSRIDGAEVAKHTSKNDCWIVLDSKAYDVTNFFAEHPGGAPIILKNAGSVSAIAQLMDPRADVN
jgi:L-lactate dehydrogenase (cytochrome)